MDIRKIWAVCYSATGTTYKIVEAIGTAMAERLSVPLEIRSFNVPDERKKVYEFGDNDLVIVGTPTYAGKMPNKIMPDLRAALVGNGATAVAVVTFGNRSYDNSLAELCSVLKKNGFHIAGAAACVAQHAMTEKLAAGRPNEEDMNSVREHARKWAERIISNEPLGEISIPGDEEAPYYVPKDEYGQPAKFLKAKPKTDLNKCTRCGICAAHCPMGSIDVIDPSAITGICIKCQACVRLCPVDAKYFDDPILLSHIAMLEQNFTDPKSNEFFIA